MKAVFFRDSESDFSEFFLTSIFSSLFSFLSLKRELLHRSVCSRRPQQQQQRFG